MRSVLFFSADNLAISRFRNCAGLLFALGLAGQLSAQQSDVSRIDALHEQRAYQQIDAYCQQLLANEELSDTTAVDIVVAWLRAATQQALEAESAEREAYWNRLGEIATVSRSAQESPQAILIRIQLALAEVVRAETMRQEVPMNPAANDKLSATRNVLRATIAELLRIDASIEELLRETYQKSASEARATGWTKSELEALRRNLAVQLARSYRNQALCYPDGSPDRMNALGLALERLADQATSSSDEDIAWKARFEQLACLRLSKRFAEARQLLEHWQQNDPTREFASALRGEALRLTLSQSDLEEAIERAALVDDPNLLISSAARFHGAGQLQEAVVLYDRAAELFAASGDELRQFEAASTAAAVVREDGKREAACERLQKLALQLPSHAKATGAHFAAIGIVAELAREANETSRPAALKRYVSMLQEHLNLWPQSGSVDTVRLWLGRYWMSQRKWQEASDVLTETAAPIGAVDQYKLLAEVLLREGEFEQALKVVEAAQKSGAGLAPHIAYSLNRFKADALAGLGERKLALGLYHTLVDRDAKNSELRESYAVLLSQSELAEDLSAAHRVWQEIEERSEPAGRRWLRARQARLELLERLGKGDQAEKLLQLTEVLYPQCSGELKRTLP